ncbi:MAG: oligosaccharide flippase family protein [Fibrobacteraceae bacterium]|nr:oligosaccharide flippase family protein [Fibrobacteraceae bacterium]
MNQIKAGAFLSYVVLALNTLVGLLYTPYMLRMLGRSEFGLYSLVASVIAYLTLLDLGFGNAIVRYTAKFRAENKVREQYEMFGMFIGLYSIIAVVAFAAGLVLWANVDSLFGSTMTATELSRAKAMLLLMSFNLAVSFPFSAFGSIITAYENFVFQKVVSIVRILLNTAVMILLLHWGYRALAMVVVMTAFNMATLLLNGIYCKKYLKIRILFRSFRWDFFREVAAYSFFIFLNAIMDRVYWSTGQFVLGAVSGTIAVAVFAVAIQLQQMYMNFSTGIVGVFLPRVTAMVTSHRSDKEISDLFIRTGRIQFCIMAFILSGFILFGKSFIIFWAGKEYENAYLIALLFFVPLTVPLIQNLGITILQARNQMQFRSVLYVIIALCSLGLQIPLARLFGGIGCALGIAFGLMLGQIVIMNIYYQRKQGLDIGAFWREIGKMSVIPILVSIIAYFVLSRVPLISVTDLLLAILVFSLVYLPLFWRFSMNADERNLFLSFFLSRLKRN